MYHIYSEYINIFRSLIGRISFRIGITLETFSSHHKLYIKEYEFTKSISDNYFWTTELKVLVSLETINGGQTPIPLETVVSSKAGFIRKIEVRSIQISYADVIVTKHTGNYSSKPKKTVKEGERRASSKILDQMNDLISEARKNKKNFFRK